MVTMTGEWVDSQTPPRAPSPSEIIEKKFLTAVEEFNDQLACELVDTLIKIRSVAAELHDFIPSWEIGSKYAMAYVEKLPADGDDARCHPGFPKTRLLLWNYVLDDLLEQRHARHSLLVHWLLDQPKVLSFEERYGLRKLLKERLHKLTERQASSIKGGVKSRRIGQSDGYILRGLALAVVHNASDEALESFICSDRH